MRFIACCEVRQALRHAGWLRVFNELAWPTLAAALQRPGRHVACPLHGGRHGDGFRLFPDVDQTGGGICATCGAYPDGFALLRWLFGWSFPEVLHQVAGVLGLSAEKAHSAPPQALDRCGMRGRACQPHHDQARMRLRTLWNESLPPNHAGSAPLQRYLLQRGIGGADFDPQVIRFHPALPYWDTAHADHPVCLGRFPAMLAVVCAPDGSAMTLHRTYLRPDGGGKAQVPAPRKLMASGQPRSLSGSAVRLFALRAKHTASLGLAEGIETALSVQAMTGEPVWAALSATLLSGFIPPPGVRRLILWADKDRSGVGVQAAQTLRSRLCASIEVRVRLPQEPIPAQARGIDWADVWQQRTSPTAHAA